jgi:predicted metal-dependent phosphoesterase TrpH/glycosyltransferase involved in cell wall biosynthesis
VVSEPFAIAQVTPHPWEDEHEVGGFVRSLSEELARRGHRVMVLAPSRSPDLVRESRRLIRAGDFFDPDGGVRVFGVGELVPLAPARRGTPPAPPLDVARTLDDLLSRAPLDFVHVHEPFAPSTASIALRHSRALNIGTFHAPAERVISTQVARRFVERFFGRLDARTASFEATQELMERSFPATYRVIAPGADPPAGRTSPDGSLHLAFIDHEDRQALRLFLRAVRRLPDDVDWRATAFTPVGARTSALRSHLRERLTLVTAEDTTEEAVLAEADVLVAASVGQAPAPGLLVRALGAGAVPVASRLAAYEEVLRDGQLGLLFEPGDVDTLTSQLFRLLTDLPLRERLTAAVASAGPELGWDVVAERFEALYDEVAARRHPPRADGEVRARLASRDLIDVDLHMHTDHSSDCATPVEVLLATARDQGLGAIAVTDHNEVSGALAARAVAHEYGVGVIVGEEVKTAHQGEVIGLFIEEKIPRGMTLEETIDAIRSQGGLVYVPHPFDRMHSVPDYEHLLEVVEDVDVIEVFNPRIAIPAYNEEAVRFAGKYRIVAGAGSDAHVAQGLGSLRIRMRDFDGPEEFLASLADADIVGRPSSLYYAQVQALKFLQTRATPSAARRAARERKIRRATSARNR